MWTPYADLRRPSAFAPGSDHPTQRAAVDDCQISIGHVALVLAAISYNAVLAIVNAHGMSLNITHVAGCEFLILLAALAMLVRTPVREEDLPALALGTLFFVGSLLLSWLNNAFVLEPLRNVVIIVIFTMVGIRTTRATMRAAFLASLALVGAVMLLELISLPTYSALFSPFRYYQNTRGLGEVDWGDSGLFGNTLGFEGRFTFGLFTTPRTASLFLEQTSLANFATFCAIYLVSLWPSAWRVERWVGVVFIVLVLLSNNTRTASSLSILLLGGYVIFPRLPRYTTLLLPFLLLSLAMLLIGVMGESKEDDLAGRIGLTLDMLKLTDVPALLGEKAPLASKFPDSGYSYVLYSSSLFGAVALWLYVALLVPFRTAEQRRCAWGIAIFFFTNLLIGGNAVFTIKVAAVLWMLAGHMRMSAPLGAAIPAPLSRRPAAGAALVRP